MKNLFQLYKAYFANVVAYLAVTLLYGAPAIAQINWQSSAMQDYGKGFENLRQALSDDSRIRGVVVIHNEQLQFEYYRQELNQHTLHDAASVTKSVLSSLIGITTETHHLNLQAGIRASMEQYPTLQVSPDMSAPTELQLWHLLTLSTGYAAQVRDRSGDYFAFKRTIQKGAALQEAWQRPRLFQPGQGFVYNNIEPHLLSILLTQLTQQTAREFAAKRLFLPLQISQYEWPSAGIDTIGSTDLKLTTRDMAKLGQLWLQDGFWEGQAIIPKQYLQQATQAYQPVPSSGILGKLGYGYLFWIVLSDATTPAAFFASGHGGQLIYVVPGKKLVVAINAESTDAQHATGAVQTARILKQHLLPIFEN
ncbi:serine hydrolase domain-containing protein [Parvibium lacunae]|nr:serine hydrolase [Parvibium lacunae]